MEKFNESIYQNFEDQKFYRAFDVKNFDRLDQIRAIGDSEKVEMGSCLLIEENNSTITYYSYGAGPCISGIIQTTDNKLYMFHSVAEELTTEQNELLQSSKNGIIGGGKETLNILKAEINNKNIKIIPPPKSKKNYDFNIVFVKNKNQFNTSPGIYFCYDQINPPNNNSQDYL